MFTIASTPAKQSVTETISTLASRLSSSTLLEDRRAAILGLRSFAKDYPASVASDALRGLITSLTKDGEDVDTVKVVLETLLMLFNPNENSPEASEEIALWLADEFTQRQDNITLLLDFLETNDFYSRLYSLQLLSAILASRTERTEECIFTAPLGISRLVAVLDDRREAVRNEALALLTYLTPSSSELQKVVAFENVFDRIFSIIKLEGSISEGDRVVEDCLILLANLLRLNVSNQSFFRETGCVPKLAQLLSNSLGGDTTGEVAEWAMLQKNRNTFALLAVLRLFLVTGGHGTPANQASFWQHGILALVLQIAFSRNTEMQIKAEVRIKQLYALITCADLIRANSRLQEGFAQLQVTSVLDEPPLEGTEAAPQNGIPKVYVIDGLLDLTLSVPTPAAFDSRMAAYGDAKSLAMSLTEGDASSGEEVVTCIQTITENLIIGIQKNVDERVLVAYLMLLSGWLYEDPDGVNDFLGEGSNIQSLVQAVVNPGPGGVLVPGLAAVLLGTIYEFSTKDSPVPRATIHPILASRMGRDLYVDRITKLRGHPLLRDFEVLPQKLSSAPQGGFPEVFFDRTFVEFIKDNFGRILRAIDRDPGMEIPIISNGVQKGISREMVDSLRSQLEQKSKALEKAEEDLLVVGRQLGQEQADHRRARETSTVELSRIKQVNEALQRHHEEDLNKIREEQNRVVQDLQRQLDSTKKTNEANAERVAQDHQRQLDHVQKTTEANAARTRKRAEAEVSDLQKSLSKLEADLEKDLKTAHDEYMTKQTEQAARLKRAEEKLAEANERAEAARIKAEKSETAALERAKEKQAIQSELDDLLMVFGDLEDKVTKYKNRLKEAGGNVTDEEDDDEEEEDEDGDGDEEEDID
ncbi:hypothetical protein M7I_6578 [Glarea lozoyensis 74030]|uniref:ARM repeat-containing protein n=1 Tax=Glarea lozoyensis (strain ATCC 74030 / MF5533) TaxID=1104152 RepID=H0EUY8_GLAL7|nr:hypothetical protein M7I_6578 [Glarea lozoyensis 74030]